MTWNFKENHMNMQILEVSANLIFSESKKSNVFHLKTIQNLKLVDWHLDEETQLVVFEKISSNIEKASYIYLILANQAYQFSKKMERAETDIESLCTKKLLTETLTEDILTVALRKTELDYQEETLRNSVSY